MSTQWWARGIANTAPVRLPPPFTVAPGDQVLSVLTASDPQNVVFAAARDCPQNPARRPHHAVGEQHPWRAASGAAGLSAHRPVLCQLARKSGAVGCSAALVSHPERGSAKISAWPQLIPPA